MVEESRTRRDGGETSEAVQTQGAICTSEAILPAKASSRQRMCEDESES